MLGHTRWASVGIISEPNAHPVTSDQAEASGPEQAEARTSSACSTATSTTTPTSRSPTASRFPGPITTDAKVIPAVVARHRERGADLVEAFRRTVSSFEGSVAIGVAAADEPGRLLLALHGSGQGVYVGLAEDRYIVASEPYGVVEETLALRAPRRRARSASSSCSTPTGPGRSRGCAASATTAPTQPVTDDDVMTAEVTTRDIDRGDAPHYLLKEISESPDELRQDAAGQDRRAATACCAPSSVQRALPEPSPSGSPPGRSPGSA